MGYFVVYIEFPKYEFFDWLTCGKHVIMPFAKAFDNNDLFSSIRIYSSLDCQNRYVGRVEFWWEECVISYLHCIVKHNTNELFNCILY